MALKFVFDPKQFPAVAAAVKERVQAAAEAAVEEAAETAADKGRANIAAGGNFGARWQRGLKYKTYHDATKNVSAVALIYHERPMAGVFQFGTRIHGTPLLWLPTTANTSASSPRKYPGRLVSVYLSGKAPMLFDKVRREPMFVGVKNVTLRKRWRIHEIVREVAGRLGEFFARHL